MRRYFTLPVLFTVLIVAGALLAGVPIDASAAGLSFAAAGLVTPGRPSFGWNRKRDQMQFTNVAASSTAYCIIPRNRRTLLNLALQLGGTTFTKALVSRIEIFLGDKAIWGPVTGAQLDAIDLYTRGDLAYGRSDYHLPIDFTFPNVKETAGEYIGGLDLSTLPDGVLRLEVDIGAATAPTLTGWFTWGAPQAPGVLGPLMQKLTRRTYPSAPAGDCYPDVDLRGQIICREFWFGDVAQAAVSTALGQGAALANTASIGAMGAITVTARTPTGRYDLEVIEPGSNVGTFRVVRPNGQRIGGGNIATAFAGGGLAFTLADGGTDTPAGDGFSIDVLPLNTDQNTNLIEVKKNDETFYFRTDRAARYEQERFGRQPLTQLFVADFLQDNHIDSVLDTQDAVMMQHRLNNTSAAILTAIFQTLSKPVL